jgi:phage I-like protein
MSSAHTTATERFVALDAGADDPRLVQLDQLIELAGDGAPPREFKLLNNGVTRTSKGDLKCDESHATVCLSHEMLPEDGLLPLDYDHGMVSFMGGEKKAAGWFKLSNRNGELWATDVKYTPAAEKALRDREYRYFSPALYRDEDGWVTRMVNCALTCLPATIKQRPLVASESLAPPAKDESTMTLEQLCAAFGAQNATQLAAKFQQLGADNVKLTADNASLVTAAQSIQTDLATAKASLQKYADAAVKAEKDAFIVEISSAGKLAPALKSWAESQTLEQLKAFGAAAPAIAQATTKLEEQATDPSKQATALSVEELAVCSQLKIDPKSFAETKALMAANSNPYACPVEAAKAVSK